MNVNSACPEFTCPICRCTFSSEVRLQAHRTTLSHVLKESKLTSILEKQPKQRKLVFRIKPSRDEGSSEVGRTVSSHTTGQEGTSLGKRRRRKPCQAEETSTKTLSSSWTAQDSLPADEDENSEELFTSTSHVNTSPSTPGVILPSSRPPEEILTDKPEALLLALPESETKVETLHPDDEIVTANVEGKLKEILAKAAQTEPKKVTQLQAIEGILHEAALSRVRSCHQVAKEALWGKQERNGTTNSLLLSQLSSMIRMAQSESYRATMRDAVTLPSARLVKNVLGDLIDEDENHGPRDEWEELEAKLEVQEQLLSYKRPYRFTSEANWMGIVEDNKYRSRETKTYTRNSNPGANNVYSLGFALSAVKEMLTLNEASGAAIMAASDTIDRIAADEEELSLSRQVQEHNEVCRQVAAALSRQDSTSGTVQECLATLSHCIILNQSSPWPINITTPTPLTSAISLTRSVFGIVPGEAHDQRTKKLRFKTVPDLPGVPFDPSVEQVYQGRAHSFFECKDMTPSVGCLQNENSWFIDYTNNSTVQEGQALDQAWLMKVLGKEVMRIGEVSILKSRRRLGRDGPSSIQQRKRRGKRSRASQSLEDECMVGRPFSLECLCERLGYAETRSFVIPNPADVLVEASTLAPSNQSSPEGEPSGSCCGNLGVLSDQNTDMTSLDSPVIMQGKTRTSLDECYCDEPGCQYIRLERIRGVYVNDDYHDDQSRISRSLRGLQISLP